MTNKEILLGVTTASWVIGVITIIVWLLSGCSHPATVISVAPAADHITAVQGSLSAVDGKTIVIEQYLKTH